MAKNIAKLAKGPVAVEMGVSNMDSKVASGNLVRSAAYDAPLESNAKRDKPHLGMEPRRGSGKF